MKRSSLTLALVLTATSASAQSDWRSAPPPSANPAQVRPVPPLFAARLQALAQGFDGIAGISVRDVDSGWVAGSRDTRLCPQQSVSKLWVAITVFDAIDRGTLTLDDRVTITALDLTLFHQPIRDLVRNGPFTTTVGDLLERAMTQSDNTANDSLLRKVGGPDAVRATLRRHGIANVRFGPGERLLQSHIAGIAWRQSLASGNLFEAARRALAPDARQRALDAYIADPIDGAAPAAVTAALASLERGTLLSASSTRALLGLMGRSKTGRARMKAAMQPGWELAHKTGTGQQLGALVAGFNDVGLLTAPDGHAYAIAVMIASSRAPIQQRQALIADVARLVIENWTQQRYAGGRRDAVY